MNDDFLHRLREAPRPAFLRELRGKLDRIEAEERTTVRPAPARSLRPLFAGILIGASALALASLAIDGHFAALQTFLRAHGVASRGGRAVVADRSDDGGAVAVSQQPGQQEQPGSLRSPWTATLRPGARPEPAAEASRPGSAVALPLGSPAAHQATPTEYGVGIAGQAGAPRAYVLLAETRAMDPFVRDPVERFASNGRYFGTAGAPKTVVDSASGVFSQFCSGAGLSSPDVVYSEHRISEPEGKACAAKSVSSAIVEFRVGREAVALARSRIRARGHGRPAETNTIDRAQIQLPAGAHQGVIRSQSQHADRRGIALEPICDREGITGAEFGVDAVLAHSPADPGMLLRIGDPQGGNPSKGIATPLDH